MLFAKMKMESHVFMNRKISSYILLSFLILLAGCSGQNTFESEILEENDFLLLLEDAEIISENDQFVEPALREIGGAMNWGIFQHAPSKINFPALFVGKEAYLDFSIGTLPDSWEREGDGIRFKITAIFPDGSEEILYSRYINPKKNNDERQWIQERIPAQNIENKEVRIVFETMPGEKETDTDNNSDWGMWGDPKLSSIQKTVVKRRKSSKPNIVFITVDTLRADYLGCYGNEWIETPAIDSLADNGIVFDRAYSPSSTTMPSHASLLTSLQINSHGALNNDYFLAKKIPRLPQILKRRTGI